MPLQDALSLLLADRSGDDTHYPTDWLEFLVRIKPRLRTSSDCTTCRNLNVVFVPEPLERLVNTRQRYSFTYFVI
jgi:hypothetical protein